MYSQISKTALLSIILPLFAGCGEVVLSDPNTSNTNNTRVESATINSASDDSIIAQEANEVIINTESNNKTLDDIVEIINTMTTISSNEEQKTNILNWIKSITLEVNELTSKDFSHLINDYKDLPLYVINENIFATDKTLHITDDNSMILDTSKALVIVKGDCNANKVSNHILVCTGNLKVTTSTNNIFVSNGSMNITSSGNTPDSNIGTILYNKNSLDITGIYNSVVLFSNPITYTEIENTDCINTNNVNGTTGVCNEITSNNLTEN